MTDHFPSAECRTSLLFFLHALFVHEMIPSLHQLLFKFNFRLHQLSFKFIFFVLVVSFHPHTIIYLRRCSSARLRHGPVLGRPTFFLSMCTLGTDLYLCVCEREGERAGDWVRSTGPEADAVRNYTLTTKLVHISFT